MAAFHEYIDEYRIQLERGAIKEAYKGLMEYIMGLRNHFKNKYPEYAVSANFYYGYMDMTFFTINPQALKQRRLKIAVVFVHDTFRFEVWLSGYNKQVQSQYWQLFKESGWDKYHHVPMTNGHDLILESVLVDNPDFRNLDALTKQIEDGTLEFMQDIESFLSKYGT